METNKVSRFTVSENDSSGAWRGGLSSDSKSLVILTMVLLMLIGSAGALTTLWVDDAAFVAASGAVAPDITPSVPYFPSQYVNQAKEIEEQPPTF